MSPEELDKARAEEAIRLTKVDGFFSTSEAVKHAARLAREGWTPPDPISPRVMAAEEYAAEVSEYRAWCQATKEDFLAGFAAAVKLAEPIMTALQRMEPISGGMITTYRQSIGDGE